MPLYGQNFLNFIANKGKLLQFDKMPTVSFRFTTEMNTHTQKKTTFLNHFCWKCNYVNTKWNMKIHTEHARPFLSPFFWFHSRVANGSYLIESIVSLVLIGMWPYACKLFCKLVLFCVQFSSFIQKTNRCMCLNLNFLFLFSNYFGGQKFDNICILERVHYFHGVYTTITISIINALLKFYSFKS